jgi:membrane protease YdiL (CAAX protease family)
VSEPQFDFPEPESSAPRKLAGGWASLWLIVLLLVGFQLSDYLFREPQGPKSHLDTSMQFKSTIQLKEVARRYPALKEISKTVDTKLDDLVSDVVDDRFSNSNAARLYVAMRFEMGNKILPTDLKFLKASPESRDRAFAQVYETKVLSRTEADNLSKKLGTQGFSLKMAKIHAYEKAGDHTVRDRLISNTDIFKPLIASMLLICAACLGVLLLIFFAVMRITGHFKPVGHPAGDLSAGAADAYAGRAATMLFIWIASSLVLSLALRKVFEREAIGLISELCVIGTALYLATRLRDAQGRPIRLFSSGKKALGDAAWGFLAVLANVPLLFCCTAFSQPLFKSLPPAEHPITFELAADQSLLSVIMIAIAAAIMAPLFEETVFRGTILPAMTRLFGGPFMGIVGSSLVFAAVHPTGIPAWPALALIGSVMAMLVYQRGSLVTSMVFHGVHNLSLVVLMLLMY